MRAKPSATRAVNTDRTAGPLTAFLLKRLLLLFTIVDDSWAFASGNFGFVCETTARYGRRSG